MEGEKDKKEKTNATCFIVGDETDSQYAYLKITKIIVFRVCWSQGIMSAARLSYKSGVKQWQQVLSQIQVINKAIMHMFIMH